LRRIRAFARLWSETTAFGPGGVGVCALVSGNDQIRAAEQCIWTLVIGNDPTRGWRPGASFQSAVWSRNQATVASTALRNGVAVQPKARWNLLLSTTQGRSD
jgi:hypothetical protein